MDLTSARAARGVLYFLSLHTFVTRVVTPRRMERWDRITLGVLVLLSLVLFAWPQAAVPMQYWDEARNGNNALEMVASGNWLVPMYEGRPDHWNTKPPMLIWIVAGFMKLGVPPLYAMRLPSFLAVAGVVALMWRFCVVVLADRLVGLLACLLLLTSGLFGGLHVARTGDYDALLTLFILLYTLCFWTALEGPAPRIRWLAAAVAWLTCAMLTKGIAAALPLPALLAYAAVRGSLPALARRWQAWALAAAAAAIGVGYYLTREIYDPGYVAAVLFNEVAGQYSQMSNSYMSYYLWQMLDRDPLLVALLPFAVLAARNIRTRQGRWALLGVLVFAVLLAVVTGGTHKHYWYMVPSYPLLTIAVALGVMEALRHVTPAQPWRPRGGVIAALALLALLAGAAASKTLAERIASQDGRPRYALEPLFAHLGNSGLAGPVYLAVAPHTTEGLEGDYNPIAKLYAEAQPRHAAPVRLVFIDHPFPPDSRVATCDSALVPVLAQRPGFMPEWSGTGCVMGRIAG